MTHDFRLKLLKKKKKEHWELKTVDQTKTPKSIHIQVSVQNLARCTFSKDQTKGEVGTKPVTE